jgi:hypothetical protein
LRKPLSRPRRRRWTLAAGLALILALGVAIPVYALGASTFDAEDGNLVVDGIEKDWANAPNRAFGDDKPTGQSDDSLGNGTKEDDPVPSVIDGSIPNNKSDLTRFYVASENVSDHDFLYLAWERVQDPSGTTNMDFEFNQSSVLSSNGVMPVRTAGDVLIKYDLSQGGAKPSFGLHRWITQGNAAQDCEASAKLPCWGKVTPLGTDAGRQREHHCGHRSDPQRLPLPAYLRGGRDRPQRRGHPRSEQVPVVRQGVPQEPFLGLLHRGGEGLHRADRRQHQQLQARRDRAPQGRR